ncbi:MAG TPA: methyltransferase domain-containing protein [Ramlibacter sp.]|nr:methyltransferase domain-containing protein [Ramlibacter sp.]
MSESFEEAKALFLEGLQHCEAGRLTQAQSAFEGSLARLPGRATTLTNLGVVRVRLGLCAQALAPLEAALAQEPDNIEALAHRAMALADLDRPVEALADAERVLALAPTAGNVWGLYGNLLKDQGRAGEAAQAFERAIALGCEPELHRFLLAGLRGDPAPRSAPAGYVQGLFDGYAEGFERHLTEALGYRAPRVLLEPLQRRGARFARALDLGCGTGLCGPLMRPLAGHLAGVDLSTNMLAKAREGGCYDELAQADIVDWLRAPHEPWDLVVAADVFVYVGELGPCFDALAGALRSGGVVAFSLEESSAGDLTLQGSLRYAHSQASVSALAQRCGFAVEQCLRQAIRNDQGQPIPGLYFWLQKR